MNKSGLYTLLVLLAGMLSLPPATAVTFQDVSANLNLTGNLTESWGAAWGDLNNDGYPDLYMSNHRTYGKLLVNNQNGGFSDVSFAVDRDGVFAKNWPHKDTHAAAWGDLDNDGDLDMVHGVSSGSSHHLANDNGILALQATNYAENFARQPLLFDRDNDGKLDVNWIAYSGAFGCNGKGEWGMITELNHAGRLDFICSNRESDFPGQIITLGSGPAVTSLPPTKRVYDMVSGDFNGDLYNDLIQIISADRPSTAYQVSPYLVESQMTSTGTRKTLTFTSSGAITFHDLSSNSWSRYASNRVYVGASGYHPSGTTFTLAPNNIANHGIRDGSDHGIYIGYNPSTSVWTVYLSATAWSYAHLVIESSAPISNVAQTPLTAGDIPSFPVYYRGSANGFQNVTSSSGLSKVLCSSGVAGDFDNDMDLDLYLACRAGADNTANILFDNQGDGSFVPLANNAGASGVQGGAVADIAGTSDSVIVADYDLDGFLDLFVINGLNMRPQYVGGPKQLFRNLGNSNHWLELDLVGVVSNRDGVGAKIYITTPDGKVQYREQNGGYHRWSQNHQRIHVGLGNNTQADIRVEWPSGVIDTFTTIPSKAIYRVTENQGVTPFTPVNSSGLSVTGTTVNEGDGSALVKVTLSPATSNTVTVDITTENGSATAGADYIAKTTTLTFSPGQTSKNMRITIIDDAIMEPTETVNIRLFNAAGAELKNANATVHINDNDTGGGQNSVIMSDNFSTNQGWVSNPFGMDTATSGHWEIGDPQETTSGGILMQPENAYSPVNALVTAAAAGKNAGSNDIDSGLTSIRSPVITLPSSGPIHLSLYYYFATLKNADSDDFLRITIQGSSTHTLLQVNGNKTDRPAVWTSFNIDISAFAGQSIRLLVEAADHGGASLVEAGIDDIVIRGP